MAHMDWEDVDAAAPNLVLTCGELEQLGVTKKMIWRRVHNGGPWRRLLPGVVMLRNGTPTPAQRIDAALRYAGDGAVLTGITAARLHGLEKFPRTGDDVHVLIPQPRQRLSSGYVVIERTTRPPAVIMRQGFPTAEVTRAVLDATRRMRELNDVRALIAEAVQRGRTTPHRLRRELDAGSPRGTALPRAALSEIIRGARSVAESWGMKVAARSGLPEMQWNARLQTPAGLILPTPDGWIDEVALALEVDSLEYHLDPGGYRRTVDRHNVMTTHGIVVVHVLPSQLRDEPDRVIARLRAAYQQAAKRPRPDIIAES